MKINDKSIDNFHFRGHLIVFVLLLGVLCYGYWIKDYISILVANALMIRPINVIAKKLFGDSKYYLKTLLGFLVCFIIGYQYYIKQENQLVSGAFMIMGGFQLLSILEYYIDRFREKNKIN